MSSDRETTRRVRSWLEEGVTALPARVLDSVLDEVPTTPQGRPLWLVRRYAEMSTYSKLAAAAVVIVAVAVTGTSFMLRGGTGADATGAPSPGLTPAPAATGAALLPGEFTLCLPGNAEFKTGVDTRVVVAGPSGDVTIDRRRGFTWKGTMIATDPRFSGTHYYSWDGDVYPAAAGGLTVVSQGHRIENDQGAWSGSSVGVEMPDGTNQSAPVVLRGEGAYAGLTAVLIDVDGTCFQNYRGFVVEVPDPPVPYTGG